MADTQILENERYGFYFRGIEPHCSGCPAFQPRVYRERLGSGYVVNHVACDYSGQCQNIKRHLENQLKFDRPVK